MSVMNDHTLPGTLCKQAGWGLIDMMDVEGNVNWTVVKEASPGCPN